MHRSPTVRQLLPIRRLLAGALVAGAVTVAIPAAANAAVSSCTYNTSNKNLIVDDRSGTAELRIVRLGDQIRIADGSEQPRFCPVPGQFAVATVTNTERIAVFRGAENRPGGVLIDGSGGAFAPGVTPEADGLPEVEIAINNVGASPFPFSDGLRVHGTPQNDVITGDPTGQVNFGADSDIDVTSNLKPDGMSVRGRDGDDIVRGTGLPPVAPGDPLFLNGDAGRDIVVGGPERDDIRGGADDDRLYSVDGVKEPLHGDDAIVQPEGIDDFAIVDAADSRVAIERHVVSSGGIGRLALTPAALQARVGKTAHMKLSWKHPKAWKALRSIDWTLMQGTRQVGNVTVRPATGRLVARGAVKLTPGSRIGHKGTTVTARLELRLPRTLADKPLSVDVAATDATGRTQVEGAAALIRLAR